MNVKKLTPEQWEKIKSVSLTTNKCVWFDYTGDRESVLLEEGEPFAEALIRDLEVSNTHFKLNGGNYGF